ncbi:ABC transporter ATP-binding protein [Dietzia sp.]|uniref:ABC transporter ATP-binding protein n=1 Tax=Dietzia sp. TaxID=1871616 RepID=UPI002FDB0641
MLQVQGLAKSFGSTQAVADISFDVQPGMTGFVGGNGAGKTTTMRMVMGVLTPDAGQVLWNGAPVDRAIRRTFGYMPEERGLYPRQKVLEQIVYFGKLFGRSAAGARRDGLELLERFDLADRKDSVLDSLSLGNQQRVQIAVAVIGRPEFLLLDEPFSGLDPEAVDSMADLLREYNARGVPVLFSSHQLDLVERLCDQLTVLSRGRVVASGSREELQRSGRIRHRLVMDRDVGWLRDSGVSVLDVSGNSAVLDLVDQAEADRLLADALGRGSVVEFAELVPSLSEIYREVSK